MAKITISELNPSELESNYSLIDLSAEELAAIQGGGFFGKLFGGILGGIAGFFIGGPGGIVRGIQIGITLGDSAEEQFFQ
jgi:hypothetical protein